MSRGDALLPTDATQILTHQNILSVGESVRQQYVDVAEVEKQRAVCSREEVVRREEQQMRGRALEQAHEEWESERQALLREAHQSQLRAIARHTSTLEEELRKEFSDTLEKLHRKHEKEVLGAVQKTWEEADVIKERAIAETRREEQAAARVEAERVAELVAEEKKVLVQSLEEQQQLALQAQKDMLNDSHLEGLKAQQKELTLQFERDIATVSADYEGKLCELQRRYDEAVATSEALQLELADMTDAMSNWQQKHNKLKLEFSDFIDQFPGFRGEFMLK